MLQASRNLSKLTWDAVLSKKIASDPTALIGGRDLAVSMRCWLLVLGMIFTVSTVQARAEDPKSLERIDGVYEFVRDEMRIEAPQKKTIIRQSTDLAGYWIFKDGFYSETLMLRDRPMWGERFPRNPIDLGYISSAGTYEIHSNAIRLREALNLNPHFVGRPYWLEFSRQGDLLILTERWEPHVENRTKGQRIVTLKKLR